MLSLNVVTCQHFCNKKLIFKTVDIIAIRGIIVTGGENNLDAKEIGRRIAELRKSFKMTKRFMAKAINVSYSTACSWEYGLRIPSDPCKKKIANLFGVTVESIFFANDNREKR